MKIDFLYNGTPKTHNGNFCTNLFATKTKKNYVDDLLLKARNTFLNWDTKKKKDGMIYFELPKDNYYKMNAVDDKILNLEWNKAATYLKDYLYYSARPSYDFLIGDTPVKIHGNYIQVGSLIIPTFTKSSWFKDLDKETKMTIYNISITINSIEINA